MVGDARAAPQSMIYSTVDTVLYTRDTRSHGGERGPHPNLAPAAPPPGTPSRGSRASGVRPVRAGRRATPRRPVRDCLDRPTVARRGLAALPALPGPRPVALRLRIVRCHAPAEDRHRVRLRA